MNLKVTRQKVSNSLVGVQAGVVRNDVIGAVLVIQEGQSQLIVKLSDLLDLISSQEGSKGDDVNE